MASSNAASTSSGLNAVLNAVAKTAARLCEARDAVISLVEGDQLRRVAHYGLIHLGRAMGATYPLDRSTPLGHALCDGRTIHVRDMAVAVRTRYPEMAAIRSRSGSRTLLAAPMLRDGAPIGGIVIRRRVVRPFTPKQIALLKSFADQAALAIENARLSEQLEAQNRTLAEALEQQTATGEILRVISQSPTDVQPVFEAIAESAARLCEAFDAAIFLRDSESLRLAAHHGPIPIHSTLPLISGTSNGRAVLEGRTVHVPDMQKETEEFPEGSENARRMGHRTILSVPLIRKEGVAIGTIILRRTEVRLFSKRQVALLQTFADQAVIAIENVRLFSQLQASNCDLTEALEQQTATSAILRVISASPTDVQPILDAIAEHSTRLCGALFSSVYRFDGDLIHMEADHNYPPLALERSRQYFPTRPSRQLFTARAVLERAVVHVPDVLLDTEYAATDFLREVGFRSVLSVPMLRDGHPIGAITVWRAAVGSFADKQIALLQTFADQAVIAIENVRLFTELEARNRDLSEALERQTATSEILRVISRSPTDVQPTFEAIATSAARLCEAEDGSVFRYDGHLIHVVGQHRPDSDPAGAVRQVFPMAPGRGSVTSRAILTRAVAHVPDIAVDPEYGQSALLSAGFHSVLSVPMLREGEPIGAISVSRRGVRPFSDAHIALLQTFADQAVIAIENVRLFSELETRNHDLSEALDQQTATGEILRVISSSPTDVQPVLDAVAESAARLCGAADALVARVEAGMLHRVAHFGDITSVSEMRPVAPDTPTGRAIIERRAIHIDDILAQFSRGDYLGSRTLHEATGFRTVLAVPLVREAEVIGAITIRRLEVRPFTDKQIGLVQTFADQAVIAIENVRLFTELQIRNRDLTEALEHQTATSEILRVISSSQTDIQPVFDTIVRSAGRLCDGVFSALFRFDGELVHFAAQHNLTPEAVAAFRRAFPMPPSRQTQSARAILERRIVHVPDLLADPTETEQTLLSVMHIRSLLVVPMFRDGNLIGTVNVGRAEPGPFSPNHIELLKTFADQAVIAIENVRLFTELQARNRELTEALEQQTATGEILRAISRSPTDAQPVFEAIVRSAVRLCNARFANVFRLEGDLVHLAAHHNVPFEALEHFRRTFPQPLAEGGTLTAQAMRQGTVVQIHDVEAQPDVAASVRALTRSAGYRSVLAVPILRPGNVVGAIGVGRSDATGAPWPFSDNEVALLQTFADQAVIAIENVRLFTELEARNRELTAALEQQTATSEILQVISQSPASTQPVFDVILSSATRLCEAEMGILFRYDGDVYQAIALRVPDPAFAALFQAPRRPGPKTGLGRLAIEKGPVHIIDITKDEAYREAEPLRLESVHVGGIRTWLGVPMLKEGQVVGAIVIYRKEVRAFTNRHIDLLTTFADQAIIAIENVRLFNELQARTTQLTRSVDQLTALGEVSRALSSTLDLETVLQTIVARANQLAGTDACSVSEYDEASEEFRLRATNNLDEEVVAVARRMPIRKGEGLQGRMALTRQPAQIPDIAREHAYAGPLREVLLRSGARALLAIPLLREDHLVGSLTVTRKTAGEFSPEVIELLQTFATQSALAIQNARLFREIEEQSRQLEVASRHKSQFLANMSHELRTPLNAILGYTELISDNIYGEVPEKMREVLERVEKSGRHLLGLINDILDLSKIEAGQLTLALNDYAMQDVVRSVASATEALARAKGLGLEVAVPDDLPIGRADERRLIQVLLNLVGNAIKFTEVGKVAIRATLTDATFCVAVTDTGPGIAESDQEKIFEEFQQADSAVARTKGGTGLGLAIARRIIEMHGGRLWLESTPGVGSTFTFAVPVRVEQQMTLLSRQASA